MGKAFLVSVYLAKDVEDDIHKSIDELEALARTCGFDPVGRLLSKRKKFDAAFFMGRGKLDELQEQMEEVGADYLLFDQELSPSQTRNIEKALKTIVLDRTAVILEIFELHAKTKAARTQVEIAKIEYMLPRLAGKWTHLEKQRGGKGGLYGKGMGETQIEVDRRILRDRMIKLKKDLITISKERFEQRKSRGHVLKVALVGYTNVGKTQLMNNLTNSGFISDDNLFVTLDLKVRVLDPKTRPKILLADTVGFIKNLPHSLIEAFKSTLEEVNYADLLLHVVDLSHAKYKDQMNFTNQVLKEIGASEVPMLYVYNKIDLLTNQDRFLPAIVQKVDKEAIAVSALDIGSVKRLRDQIYRHFEKEMIPFEVTFSYDQGDGIAFVKQVCREIELKTFDESIIFSGKTTMDNLIKMRQYGGAFGAEFEETVGLIHRESF